MIKKIFKWLISRIINHKIEQKAEKCMENVSVSPQKRKISSREFKCSTDWRIKRVGKNIVIVGDKGAIFPLSKKHIENLRNTVLKNNNSAIIKANGLSRAQMGRIVRDFIDGQPNLKVYFKKIPAQGVQGSHSPQPTNFKILLMKGENHEKT